MLDVALIDRMTGEASKTLNELSERLLDKNRMTTDCQLHKDRKVPPLYGLVLTTA